MTDLEEDLKTIVQGLKDISKVLQLISKDVESLKAQVHFLWLELDPYIKKKDDIPV